MKNLTSQTWGFKNMPVGTWFVQVSAEGNDEIWQKIKDKEVRGFSIEGWFTDKLVEASKQKCTDCVDEVTLSRIKDVILQNELNPVAELDGEPLFRTKEEAELYAEMFKSVAVVILILWMVISCLCLALITVLQQCERNIHTRRKRKGKKDTRC